MSGEDGNAEWHYRDRSKRLPLWLDLQLSPLPPGLEQKIRDDFPRSYVQLARHPRDHRQVGQRNGQLRTKSLRIVKPLSFGKEDGLPFPEASILKSSHNPCHSKILCK